MLKLCVHQWLRPVPYTSSWEAMRTWTANRDPSSVDQLWLLHHEPVYTQGLAGKAEHVLSPGKIPVVQTDRGGQITYHGPEQLMMYTLFDIERMGLATREYVRCLEQVVIDVLAEYGVSAAGKVDAPGVYVGERKICSIGLRIKKGCSYHGLALNVAGGLAAFKGINPCGYSGLSMASLDEWASVDWELLGRQVVAHIGEKFGFAEPSWQTNEKWCDDE